MDAVNQTITKFAIIHERRLLNHQVNEDAV